MTKPLKYVIPQGGWISWAIGTYGGLYEQFQILPKHFHIFRITYRTNEVLKLSKQRTLQNGFIFCVDIYTVFHEETRNVTYISTLINIIVKAKDEVTLLGMQMGLLSNNYWDRYASHHLTLLVYHSNVAVFPSLSHMHLPCHVFFFYCFTIRLWALQCYLSFTVL